MRGRPPRSAQSRSSAASDVYKGQGDTRAGGEVFEDLREQGRPVPDPAAGGRLPELTERPLDRAGAEPPDDAVADCDGENACQTWPHGSMKSMP